MSPGNWLEELPITNGTIFAYALNNYWFTNYKAGQDGEFVFRYGLTSDKSMDPVAASLFGESVVAPMRAVHVTRSRKNNSELPAGGFCQVDAENVTLTTAKRADDGKGVIVRLREMSGQDTEVEVTTSFEGVTKASRCDLVERVQGPLGLKDGKISLKIKGNSMATIRLE